MHRDSTWDIRVGFDKIRWTDDEATVRSLYPEARATTAYVGQDPLTGETVVVRAGLVLDVGTFGLPINLDGVYAYLRVEFEGDRVSQISLVSDGGDERFHDVSSADWVEVISDRVTAVGRVFGLRSVKHAEERQEWSVGGVKIDLQREWKSFHFTLERSA
ncbi:MAG: hypothetical protein AB7P03_00480 [Kofleriaceae bacterium]